MPKSSIMTQSDYRKVLVTGGTGFIGAHIVDNLLKLGIQVRLTTRSSKKALEFADARPQFKHLIEPYEIPDFNDIPEGTNPFIDAVKGVDGIVHAASPLDYSVKNVEEELIKPAIMGVRIVLEAAQKEPGIKRIVLTSSFGAVMDVEKGNGPGFSYSGKDWNPLTYEESCKSPAVIAYRGSKKYAELEAWDFVKKYNTSFDLVTFCPPMTFGPVVHPVSNVEYLNLSNKNLWEVYKGTQPLPETRVNVWIDVRDLAKAHVQALITDRAGGKRYVPGSPEKFSYEMAAAYLQANGMGEHITKDYSKSKEPEAYDLDFGSLQKDLGIDFISFEQCVTDSVAQFIELK